MSIKLLRSSLIEHISMADKDMSSNDILEWIDSYIETEDKKYKKQKDNRQITWGKYRGYSVKELSLTEKGSSYLEWTLSQSWVTPDKFGWFIDDCKALKITKKTTKRASLE